MVIASAEPQPSPPEPAAVPDDRERRRAVLWALFAVLDEEGVPYCTLRGYQGFPAEAGKDIDLLLPSEYVLQRLATLLQRHRERIGAEVVQWNAANYVVLAARDAGTSTLRPCFLHLDIARDLERAGHRFYRGTEVLAKRRRYERWWAPAPATEFAYYVVEKIIKGSLGPDDGERLSRIYQLDPSACAAEIHRLWGAADAALILDAAATDRWDAVASGLPQLRAELLRRTGGRQPLRALTERGANLAERAKRWLSPSQGMHVVLLGPDGVGKSSVIEAVQADLAPAFGGPVFSDAFAPSLMPQRAADLRLRTEQGPHALPPRSLPASLAKALYWTLYYSLGYYVTIYPALARTSLAINHRYLIDALVDQRRYRYAGPPWPLRLAWWLARKPDLVILLDAPAEVIQRRKSEVPLAETERQRGAYLRAVSVLDNGHTVDADRPLPEVVDDVNAIILRALANRVSRRIRFGAQL